MCIQMSLLAQQTVGLFTNEPTALDGYTLLAPIESKTTYLIDNCGDIVHTWSSLFSLGEVCYLLENGQLLRAANLGNSNFSDAGSGGRIELWNWEGDLAWAYQISNENQVFHHDLAYMPNGNILAIAWQKKTKAEAVAAGRDTTNITEQGLLDEVIYEIEPLPNNEANIIWEWHLWDHLIQDFDSTKSNYDTIAHHPELVNLNFEGLPNGPGSLNDWVHLNSIDYNESLDQIVISARSFSEFWILDHSTTTQEAASHEGGNSGRGGDLLYRWGNPQTYAHGTPQTQTLFGQHDVHWIKDGLTSAGKIMVFNNGNNRPDGTVYSSVDIIDTPLLSDGNYAINTDTTFGPVMFDWSYSIFPDESFFANFISGAQRLPNGNTLICDGPDGYIFEITPDFEVVWEYINPVKAGFPLPQGSTVFNNNVFRAYKFAPNHPALIGKTLTPMLPVELNPLPSTCELFPDSTVTTQELLNTSKHYTLHPNPTSEVAYLQNAKEQTLQVSLYNMTGKYFDEVFSSDKLISLPISALTQGVYIVRIHNFATNTISTQKLIIKR